MSSNEEKNVNTTEWVVFSVSMLILLSVIVFLFYHWFWVEHTPAVLHIEKTAPAVRVGNALHIPYRVWNSGTSTAENIRIQAVLHAQSGSEKIYAQQIILLSGGEEIRGVFICDGNDGGCSLDLRITGYLEP